MPEQQSGKHLGTHLGKEPGPLSADAATPRFSCDACGACCRLLPLMGPMYRVLDSGDGVCRYLDRATNLCSVYDVRPLQCRVEEGYSSYFAWLPYDTYLAETAHACRLLKQALAERTRCQGQAEAD